MKTMMKFLLLVFLTTIAFFVVSALMPYSTAFKAINQSADPSVALYILATISWTCFTIVYIVKRSRWEKKKLMIVLPLMLFLVLSFMMQIETMFFGHAFKVLTIGDILLIMIANGTVPLVAAPLSLILFRRKDIRTGLGPAYMASASNLFGSQSLLIKLALTGIIYVVIYFVFGYFVAWQVSDLRAFYTGRETDNGFIGGLIDNLRDRPVIFPFQFFRGVLFGLFVLPLAQMFSNQPRTLLISLLLVFSTVSITLIIPNALFPDSVRWGHFREMMSSMSVFAVVVWWIYAKYRVRRIQSSQG
ncbi:hypothetical protein WBG78_16390 [Chryseolinea sp. T2]|uniref:hypothetical protein n=1 Tax=Chryseolinea sp. T2 TaxID=3129255 RepID=UPI003076CB3A